jgi:hypothetical protein
MTLAVVYQGYGAQPDYSEPAEDDIVVRQSTIGSMQLCPGRVGLSLTEGFDHTPSEAMVFGTMVHNLIEAFLSGKDTDGAWPLRLSTDAAILAALMQAAEKDGFTVEDVASPEVVQRVVNEVRSACFAWYSDVWQAGLHQVDAVGIEHTMTIPLGLLPSGQSIWLQGTPDLYTPGTAYDWKTSGRPWSESKQGLTKGSFNQQAPIYLALIEASTGLRPRQFVFVVYDRSTGQWSEHETTWADETIAASLLNAWEVGKQIAAQAFPYTPATDNFGKYERGWHCSAMYCGAWNICPGKAMVGDGADLTQTRSNRWQ